MDLEMKHAKEELGTERFEKHLRNVFGTPCLDFVKTIVINLPEPCYADCTYCIDKDLRKHTTDNDKFMKVCEKVLLEFPNARSVSITGGTLNHINFNKLTELIKNHLPESSISWNTNGVGLDESYSSGIARIKRVNLHRNALDEEENKKIFKAKKRIITLDEAKDLMGEKLFIRATVDENFDIDEYVKVGVPLYINRLLPGTEKTDANFNQIMKKLNIENVDRRRRNVYLSSVYQDVPIRVCLGDKLAECVPGRKPTYLNVAIVHRSGIVCGSWYENDKDIYNPNNELENGKPKILKK